MKFLKGLLATLLTFLLFLSLAAFGSLFALRSTLLDPDFVVAQVEKLDVAALAEEVIDFQSGGQVPPEASFLEEALYSAIAENEPQLKEQVSAAIYDGYDYLLGKSDRLNISVSLAPIKKDLKDRLWQSFEQNKESLPPEVAALPPEMLEQYFEEFYRQFEAGIPSEFVIDESSIPPDMMTLVDILRENARYIQTAYYGLIALMVVLVAGIILLHRSVKGATRELGITFLIYGIIEYAGVWATQRYLPSIPLPDIPPSMQVWLNGFINDLIAPMQVLGIGLMVSGAVLIIVSIVYPRLRPAEEKI
ncbi:MAG: hypothetical protein E3J57_00950 [Dehalococcoidia bacterium]|jgi:hypothetical protein|nr:MAG: hypothetical protein E3J57_00950 [Dehalococcoidia bacterium]